MTRSPWASIPDSILTPLASCCGTSASALRESGVSGVGADPVLNYACPIGAKAVSCFKTTLNEKRAVEGSLFISLAQELSPGARTFLMAPGACGRLTTDPAAFIQCFQAKWLEPDSELIGTLRKEGANLSAVRSRLTSWSDQVAVINSISLACDRLQGNVATTGGGSAATRWIREDPECLPGIQVNSMDDVDFLPTPVDITKASALADDAVALTTSRTGRVGDQTVPPRPKSAVEPVVDQSLFGIGATRRECPKHLDDMGCVPRAGPWSPGLMDNGVSQDVDRAFPELREVMFADLGQHSVEMIGQTYISALMVLSPDNLPGLKKKKAAFLEAASCLTEEARGRLEGAFSVTEVNGLSEKVAKNRARLGLDLLRVSKKVLEAEKLAAQLEREFRNDGKCGFIADRYHTIDSRLKCRENYAQWKMAERTRDEGFANFPIFAEQLEGARMLDRLAQASTADAAIQLHDRVLAQVTNASLSRVREACQDPVRAGKMAVLNPVIARSYLEETPDAAWVFCSAYTEIERDTEIKEAARITFLAGSLLVTGGWSGLVFAGISTGLTIHDIYNRQDSATRNREEYLAGVGNVDAYLEARAVLNDFYRDAALDLGLEGLGLVPELGVLRAWKKAGSVSRAGTRAFLGAAEELKVVRWYRSRLDGFFGDAVRALSDAEVKALAMLEEAGLDLSRLEGVACSI